MNTYKQYLIELFDSQGYEFLVKKLSYNESIYQFGSKDGLMYELEINMNNYSDFLDALNYFGYDDNISPEDGVTVSFYSDKNDAHAYDRTDMYDIKVLTTIIHILSHYIKNIRPKPLVITISGADEKLSKTYARIFKKMASKMSKDYTLLIDDSGTENLYLIHKRVGKIV